MEKIRFQNKYSYTKLLLVMFGYPRLELAHFLGLADNDVLSEVEDLRIVGAEKGGDGHFQRHRVVRQHELHKTHVRAQILALFEHVLHGLLHGPAEGNPLLRK